MEGEEPLRLWVRAGREGVGVGGGGGSGRANRVLYFSLSVPPPSLWVGDGDGWGAREVSLFDSLYDSRSSHLRQACENTSGQNRPRVREESETRQPQTAVYGEQQWRPWPRSMGSEMEPVNSPLGASHTAEVGVCRAVYRSQVPDLDVKQPSLSTLFILFLCLFFCCCCCHYGPFNCISFHKFFQQRSTFLLCSSGFISALLVLSTTYMYLKVSLALTTMAQGTDTWTNLCAWLGLKHLLTILWCGHPEVLLCSWQNVKIQYSVVCLGCSKNAKVDVLESFL